MMTEPKLKKDSTDYYSDKVETLNDVFGTDDIILETDQILIKGHAYPVIEDVIILLPPAQYPVSVQKKLSATAHSSSTRTADFAEDIQFTFGAEWLTYPEIMPEHESEVALYFDIIDTSSLQDSRLCDLGCGIGRWSYFLKDKCRELVLVDFSEAIFVARRNLKEARNAIFFMGDLTNLPFRKGFADFLFCLGVLHHLPVNALNEVRSLKNFAPTILIYLYYALDNRPKYFRALLAVATFIRMFASKIRNPSFRNIFSTLTTLTVYMPFIYLGKILKPFGLSNYAPLYEIYNGKSIQRIKQDVYDRFFTRIEQRVTKKQIMTLNDSFQKITVSDHLPYWHFKCENETDNFK